MLRSGLRWPDDAAWHDDWGHSAEISSRLTAAYSSIRQHDGRVEAYHQVIPELLLLSRRRMSRRQRLRVYFLLASCFAALDQYTDGLYWIDRALGIALQLDARDEQVDLLYLRASLHRALLRLREGLDDLDLALAIMDRQRDVRGIDDPEARLSILAQLATYAFFLTEYDVAQLAISQARLLPLPDHASAFDRAAAEWVQAHLFRLRRQPERSLGQILSVHEVYLQQASPVSQDRMEFFIAEVALDWAEHLPMGSDRNALLTLARPHLRHAERLARESGDRPGASLARIARTRYSRLTNGSMDRLKALEGVVREGVSLPDVAVRAQGLTALGDELAARGEMEQALSCYRTTLDVLRGSEVPVLGVPARRALLRAQELSDDRADDTTE